MRRRVNRTIRFKECAAIVMLAAMAASVFPLFTPTVSATSSIALDTVATNVGSGSFGSVTINHAANAILVIEVGKDWNGCPGNVVASTTVGGYPANQYMYPENDPECQNELEVWYLYRASAGYETVSVSFTSNNCCSEWAIMVMSFTGVDSSNPFQNPTAGTGNSYAPQLTVSGTLAGRRVLFLTASAYDHCGDQGSCPYHPPSLSYGYGQTPIDSTPTSSSDYTSLSSSYEDSDSSTYMYVSLSGVTPWAASAFALAPVSVTQSITVTSSPTGSGFVTVDGSPIATPQTYSWTTGTTHTLAASSLVSCGSGCQYIWQSWSDGGAQSHQIAVQSNSTTYTAIFQQQYSLTISAGTGGTTSPVPSTSWIPAGQDTSVSATPDQGYIFNGWTLDGQNVGNQNPYTVTINRPHNLTANFAPPGSLCPYVNTDPPGLTPQPSQMPSCPIAPGTQVTVTAQPIPNWKFENFTVSGVTFAQNRNIVTFIMPSSPVSAIARYSSAVVPPAEGIAIPGYNVLIVILWGMGALLFLFDAVVRGRIRCRRQS